MIENNRYHVYNRTNNKEILFRSERNKHFFIRKLFEYLSPLAGVYSYTLQRNHFHFVLLVKSREAICEELGKKKNLSRAEISYVNSDGNCSRLMEKAFQKLFISYSKALNKENARAGNLFNRPFKRILIESEEQFKQAIIYVHANPLKHGATKNFTTYKWSTWNELLDDGPTRLLRKDLIEWFGGKKAFVDAHFELVEFYDNLDISIEE